MEAYLICEKTRKAICLGKPIREPGGRTEYYHSGPANGDPNHEDALLNRVLWKFLAEHARQELRIVFSGDFRQDDFEFIWTSDVEAENYVWGWPPRTVD